MAIMANSSLADIFVEEGQLHQAARIYTENLQLAARVDGPNSPFAGKNLIGLGRVFYAWNDLEKSETVTRQGIRLSQQWGDQELQIAGYLTLARLERARGNIAALQEAAQAAEQLANEHRLSPRWSVWIGSSLARLRLEQGNAEPAHILLRENAITLNSPFQDAAVPYLLEPAYLTLLRLFMERANPAAALALSARLLQSAETAGHTGWVIEILVLQAMALQEKKELPQALSVLARALALAQSENFRRVFLDEGERMARLLHYAKAQRIANAFAVELLSLIDPDGGLSRLPAQALLESKGQPRLVEALSPRELEVLSLIEAGCSNQDIAARLVISVKTVKRHTSNIFGKLGVKNRTQAVSLARELKLLQ